MIHKEKDTDTTGKSRRLYVHGAPSVFVDLLIFLFGQWNRIGDFYWLLFGYLRVHFKLFASQFSGACHCRRFVSDRLQKNALVRHNVGTYFILSFHKQPRQRTVLHEDMTTAELAKKYRRPSTGTYHQANRPHNSFKD